MISFESDYIAGAHPDVLAALCRTNLEPAPGYGEDDYTKSAAEKIRRAFGCPRGDVSFLVGGTQVNAVVLASLLADFEGVVTAVSGHLHAHEAGAIEYAGHKTLALPGVDGKLRAQDVRALVTGILADENREHLVYPGAVYISHPTESGTLYTKAELAALADVCREFGMRLFLDGARLGYGLGARDTDVLPEDLSRYCDVFTVGGTKVGALCGEAAVFPKGNRPAHFVNFIKKRGALLAKGRLLGVQFDALFTNDLYFRIGRETAEKTEKLKAILARHDCVIDRQSPTNQQFVLLEDGAANEIARRVRYGFWEKKDETHTVVRFAVSWSTTDGDLEALDAALGEVLG